MNYIIHEQLGKKGGFGAVYACTDEMGNRFAIKILDSTVDNEGVERFRREVRILSRLSHPYVIRVVASQFSENQNYYIMPIYRSNLRKMIGEIYGDYERQFAVLFRLIDGIAYCHSEGVLHRDLKPENILCNNEFDIAIADFGLGRQLESESGTLTQLNNYGTPGYCSPEQGRGMHFVDVRTDIYALGVIIEDIFTNNNNEPLNNDVIKYVVDKCTKQKPDERFKSIYEVRDILLEYYNSLCNMDNTEKISLLMQKLMTSEIDQENLLFLSRTIVLENRLDDIERFFRLISYGFLNWLTEADKDISQKLIERLTNFWQNGSWPFSYIDTVADVTTKIFSSCSIPKIRASVLYTLILLANRYNRYYAIGTARTLIVQIENDIPLRNEFQQLVAENRMYLDNMIPPLYGKNQAVIDMYNRLCSYSHIPVQLEDWEGGTL